MLEELVKQFQSLSRITGRKLDTDYSILLTHMINGSWILSLATGAIIDEDAHIVVGDKTFEGMIEKLKVEVQRLSDKVNTLHACGVY